MIQRKGIIIYFENEDVLKKLDKTIVNIFYVSKREKYAIIYCDLPRYKPLMNELKKLAGITEVTDSLLGVEENAF